MNYLLDTCVISEFIKRQPEPRVITWLDQIDEDKLFLSAITIGEIQYGIEKSPDSHRKTELLAWLNNDLLQRFTGRILPLDAAAMLGWGTLASRLEQSGRRLGVMDGLIAATALQNNLILVTRNTSDFMACGLQITNPWE